MIDKEMKRWLAQKVVCPQGTFGLSVVTLVCEQGKWRWTVEPFVAEIHSTSFFNGTIRIEPAATPHGKPELFFEPM